MLNSTVAITTTTTTTAALVTPLGRGAVATVQIWGSPSDIGPVIDFHFHPRNRRQFITQPVRRILFGDWTSTNPPYTGDNSPVSQITSVRHVAGEAVVICRVNTQTTEVHCHGGTVAANRILKHLEAAGVTVSSWPALVQGNHGLLEREWAEALSATKTARAADSLLGMRPARLAGLVNSLLAGLDTTPFDDASARSNDFQRLNSAVANAPFGLRLTEPFRIVLTGRPNVGKSSLLNALLGFDRAIVAPIPGTTRDIVTGETAFAGWPCLLMDSAGIRETADPLETAGIAATRHNIVLANLVILVLDQSQPLTPADRDLLQALPTAIVVANKADCPGAWSAIERPNSPQLADGSESHPKPFLLVSAKTHAGQSELVSKIESYVVPELPKPEEIFPISPRQANLLAAAANAWQASNWPAAKEFLTRILTG